jgi:hypothetical protein
MLDGDGDDLEGGRFEKVSLHRALVGGQEDRRPVLLREALRKPDLDPDLRKAFPGLVGLGREGEREPFGRKVPLLTEAEGVIARARPERYEERSKGDGAVLVPPSLAG